MPGGGAHPATGPHKQILINRFGWAFFQGLIRFSVRFVRVMWHSDLSDGVIRGQWHEFYGAKYRHHFFKLLPLQHYDLLMVPKSIFFLTS